MNFSILLYECYDLSILAWNFNKYSLLKTASAVLTMQGVSKFCHQFCWCHWYWWQIWHRCQRNRRKIYHRCQWHRWQTMGTTDCWQLKVNWKGKIYLYANSTVQTCPQDIMQTFVIWRFFPFATCVNDTGDAPWAANISANFRKNFETVLMV